MQTVADHRAAPDQSLRFMLLYALAAAGGATAYIPFLTVLLPVKVSALAGADNLHWLAWLTFGGAIAASLTNILFGWLSDRTRNRKGWILAGLDRFLRALAGHGKRGQLHRDCLRC